MEEMEEKGKGKVMASSPSSPGLRAWSRLASRGLCMARRSLQVGNFIPSMETTIKSGGESLIKFTRFFISSAANIFKVYV